MCCANFFSNEIVLAFEKTEGWTVFVHMPHLVYETIPKKYRICANYKLILLKFLYDSIGLNVDLPVYFGSIRPHSTKCCVYTAACFCAKKNRQTAVLCSIALLIYPKVFEDTIDDCLCHRLLEFCVIDLLVVRGVTDMPEE